MLRNRTLLKYILSAAISVTLGALLLLLGRSIVGNIIGVSENFYLKYYYDILNTKNFDKWNYTIPDSLTIINIQNYSNRHDLATILNKVYEMNPKVIGLDCFFGNNPDVRDNANSDLVSVIKKVQDKLVVPCYYSLDSLGKVHTVYPFFHNMTGIENLTYASPLAHEFYGYYTIDDSSIKNKCQEDSILHRMSIEIARKSKMEMMDYNGNFYVNYCKKDFAQIICSDTLDIRPSMIQDYVVLIGDMSDIKDMTKLPFRFGEKDALSGIEDIAYSLICILNQSTETLDARMRMKGFTDCSPFFNYIISFILAIFFSVFQSFYASFKKRQEKKGRCFVVFALVLQPLTFIVTEIIIVCISYIYTYFTNQLPDLFFGMVVIALVSISMEITKVLIPEK